MFIMGKVIVVYSQKSYHGDAGNQFDRIVETIRHRTQMHTDVDSIQASLIVKMRQVG